MHHQLYSFLPRCVLRCRHEYFVIPVWFAFFEYYPPEFCSFNEIPVYKFSEILLRLKDDSIYPWYGRCTILSLYIWDIWAVARAVESPPFSVIQDNLAMGIRD